MRPTPTMQSRYRGRPDTLAPPASRPGRFRRPRWLAGLVAAGVLALLGASAVPVGATPGVDDNGADTPGVVSPSAAPPGDGGGGTGSNDAAHNGEEASGDAPSDEAEGPAGEIPTDEPGMRSPDGGDTDGGKTDASTGERLTAVAEAQVAVATLGGQTIPVAGLPWDDDDMGICDPDRDGWHFVMPGVQTLGGVVPTADDFGPVMFTSNSGAGTAPFTDMTGPVAHFLDATGTISRTASILAASMTFPETTSVTDFVQFRLSHSPCGDDGGNGNGNGDNGNGNGNGDNGTDITDDDNGTDITDDDNGTNPSGNPGNPSGNPGNPGDVALASSNDAAPAPPTMASTGTSFRPAGGALPVTGATALPLALLALGLVSAGGAGWAASRRAGTPHRSRTRT